MARLRTGLLLALALGGQVQAARVDAEVERQARTQSGARVLVSYRADAEGKLPATSERQRAQRRRLVAARGDELLAALPHGHFDVRRRFALVPALALRIDAEVLQHLRQDPRVLAIEQDLPGRGSALAPDTASVLNAVDALVGLGYDGSGMKVAVIDSGVDTDHPDLQSSLVDESCFCTGCCPNGRLGPGSAEDDHGHGSHVAGIIVGDGNVAPRGALPEAQLVAVKVLDGGNGFCCTSDIVAALDWVASAHPDVDAVNLSLGTDAMYAGDCDGAANAMSQAVAAVRANGAVVVASSGNDGNANRMENPACIRDVVSTAATWDFSGGTRTYLGCTETSTEPRKPTCFSNRSPTTDLYAAGAFVTSAGRFGNAVTMGGTSMAAPMVAACATALKQAVPASTPAQRADALRLSPTQVTDVVSGRSYPFLDCLDALDVLGAVPPLLLSIADASSVVEGHFGARALRFAVALNRPASGEGVLFDIGHAAFASRGGAAHASIDFVPVARSDVRIAPGEQEVVIAVKVLGDRRLELDESVLLRLSNVRGANVTRDSARGRILNDD